MLFIYFNFVLVHLQYLKKNKKNKMAEKLEKNTEIDYSKKDIGGSIDMLCKDIAQHSIIIKRQNMNISILAIAFIFFMVSYITMCLNINAMKRNINTCRSNNSCNNYKNSIPFSPTK